MDIWENFLKSVKQLKHPVLFVPDLVLISTTLILSLVFFKLSGLNQVISSFAMTEGFQEQLFKGLFADKWAMLVVGTVLFFVMSFIIGVGADLLRFNIIKDIIAGKKKPTLAAAMRDSRGMFMDVVVLKILVYLLSLVVFLATAFFALLIYMALGKLSVISMGLVAVFGIAALIALRVFLLFRYPILFLDGKKYPVKIIKESFEYAKHHMRYAVFMVVVLFLVFVLFNIFTLPINAGLDICVKAASIGVLATAVGFLSQLIKAVVNLVYSVWMHLFVFNSYVDLKKSKN